MPLQPGTRLGPYEISAPLGTGGMGEVYRATDTKLRREVAIKVLRADVTQDPDRIARLEREARALASLNHPNIATLHGFESEGRTQFLVMELVEGETLADRIARGPVPIDEALPLFHQIAEGLEAAHEAGVIHRDLKPANLKVTAAGKVKILDFGLAKAVDPDQAASHDSDISESPTLTMAATRRGEILGTAAYMSPEQAKGKKVDRRTDIWAFGACLLEALSGKKAFGGDDAAEMMASILLTEPQWDRLPRETPAPIRRLVRRCLQRQVADRLQHIGDARLEILQAIAEPSYGAADPADEARRPAWQRAPAWGIAGLIAGAVLSGLAIPLWTPATAPPPGGVTRLSIPLPAHARIKDFNWPANYLALSPDGARLVYKAGVGESLHLRSLDDLTIRALAGTDGATNPFFSPDGRYIAFFTRDGELKKIEARSDAPPLTVARGIANAPWAFGSWGDDGRIVYSVWGGGLSLVEGDGGTPVALTQPEGEADQSPHVLPGARAALFYSQEPGKSRIRVLKLDGKQEPPATLIDNGSHPYFVDSGHLLFVREGNLLAVRFDPVRLTVSGSPRAVPIEVTYDEIRVAEPVPQLAVSRTGTLVYAPARGTFARQSDLVWVGRDGAVEPIGTVPVPLPHLQLSPDNTQIALEYRDGPDVRISIYDMVDHGIDHQVATKKQEHPGMPVWTPDGEGIVFSYPGNRSGDVVVKRLRGGAEERLFRAVGNYVMPRSFTADGRLLAFGVYPEGNKGDIGVFELGRGDGGGEEVRPVISTPQSEHDPALSPDGRWIAFVRDREVYVAGFPSGPMRRVSHNGGFSPLWSPDGREIFWQRGWDMTEDGTTEVWARTATTAAGLDLGEPKKLFEGFYLPSDDAGQSYDISRDGRRFLMVRTDEFYKQVSEFIVVQNWFEDLNRLVPAE